MDLFVVPTLSFRLLYGLLILKHGRRHMLWLGVTAHPTAEWIARQLTEACGWEPVPRYILRDRDSVYGEIFKRRLRTMGIRDRPTAPRSPWQNGHTERLIGSIRRECLDHVVVFGERHLRQILLSYMAYYNDARTLMRRCRGLFRPSDAFFRLQFSADYTITMFGVDFRQGQRFDPIEGFMGFGNDKNGIETLTTITCQYRWLAHSRSQQNQSLAIVAANPKRLRERLYCVNVSTPKIAFKPAD